MNGFIRSITDSLSQAGNNLESQVGKLIPITDYYWLGGKVGTWTDYLIPDGVMDSDEVSAWFRTKMDNSLELHRMERKTRMVRPSNLPDTVTILPTSSLTGEKKSIFDLLEEDFVDVITEAKPIFGSREILRSQKERYVYDTGLTDMFSALDPDYDPLAARGSGGPTDMGEVLETDAIIAPFSRYTPTILWPFSTSSGKRYTVHDLGEEELNFPGKFVAEYALGRELDQVGALPGFHNWGDPLLGTGPVVIGGTALALLGLTAFFWGPAIGKSLASTAQSAVFGTLELARAVGSKAKEVAKAPF